MHNVMRSSAESEQRYLRGFLFCDGNVFQTDLQA